MPLSAKLFPCIDSCRAVRRGTRDCALAHQTTTPNRLARFDLPQHNFGASRGGLVLFPWFVLYDEKLLTTVLTRCRSKEDRGSGPKIQGLLVAVRAFEVMSIEIGKNLQHLALPITSIDCD